jgi:Type IV secretion-system coupling protein DNA-binding domain
LIGIVLTSSSLAPLNNFADAKPGNPQMTTCVTFWQEPPRPRQSEGILLSVRRWIREGRGVLFLPYQANEIESLRNLISAWMRLAIFEVMSGPEGVTGESGSPSMSSMRWVRSTVLKMH